MINNSFETTDVINKEKISNVLMELLSNHHVVNELKFYNEFLGKIKFTNIHFLDVNVIQNITRNMFKVKDSNLYIETNFISKYISNITNFLINGMTFVSKENYFIVKEQNNIVCLIPPSRKIMFLKDNNNNNISISCWIPMLAWYANNFNYMSTSMYEITFYPVSVKMIKNTIIAFDVHTWVYGNMYNYNTHCKICWGGQILKPMSKFINLTNYRYICDLGEMFKYLHNTFFSSGFNYDLSNTPEQLKGVNALSPLDSYNKALEFPKHAHSVTANSNGEREIRELLNKYLIGD
jgi:hypothetical protein